MVLLAVEGQVAEALAEPVGLTEMTRCHCAL